VYFPEYRPRRMRKNEAVRKLIRETRLSPDNLIYPIFVAHGEGVKKEIATMSGQYQLSVDMLVDEVKEVESLQIPAIILFGIPEKKDEAASEAYAEDGIVQQAIRKIKEVTSNLVVITDV